MQSRIPSVDSEIDSHQPINSQTDFGLEIAELEMILDLKVDEDLDFFSALPSALVTSGNEWLFDFPAERFPIPATNVAAIRLHAGDDYKICYVYEALDGSFQVVDAGELGTDYLEFAESWLSVARALQPLMAQSRGGELH